MVRRLAGNEVARFRRIRLDALRDAPVAYGTSFEVAMAWSDDAWRKLFGANTIFVAVVGGRDVGMVRTGPEPRKESAARLGSLWVSPEVRGRGIGSALVEAVVQWVRERGCTQLVLDVSDDNRSAIALYARRGFEPNGDVSAFPPPREHLTKHGRILVL